MPIRRPFRAAARAPTPIHPTATTLFPARTMAAATVSVPTTSSLGFVRIGGQCVSHNAKDPSNPCRYCDATINQHGWTNASSSASCDDGLWCNGDDTCDGSAACEHNTLRTDALGTAPATSVLATKREILATNRAVSLAAREPRMDAPLALVGAILGPAPTPSIARGSRPLAMATKSQALGRSLRTALPIACAMPRTSRASSSSGAKLLV